MSYTDDRPRGTRYMLRQGHVIQQSYRKALDRLEVDDINFYTYDSHRESHPVEDIIWFSGWIMCGMSCYRPHLPECVLRQFGYVQNIPRHYAINAPYTMIIYQMEHAL